MRHRSVLIALVLTALSIAMPRTASAQMGVLVGINSANVDFDADDAGFNISGDRRAGFVGGVSFNLPLQDMFSVEADALFAQKGTEFSFAGETGKARANYLDIPVLGRINLTGSDTARVHLFVGPSFNFKLSESFDPDEGNDEDEFETFEAALVFGGGVTVSRFRIDLRYGLGLSNILTESAGGDVLTGKNRVFSILVGYGR